MSRLMLAFLVLFASGSSLLAKDLVVPNLKVTPGVWRRDLSVDQICHMKWGADRRHVTASMKAQAFRNYGLSGNDDPACVPDAHRRRCEVDHLISRELGGADNVRNLWPEPYGTQPWNAVRKDRLESRLHKEVCAGHITLEQARRAIMHDWRKAYRKYFGEPE